MLAETVIDAGDREAVLRKAERGWILLAAINPATAVNPDDEREFLTFLRQVQIQFLVLVLVAHVGNVPMCNDAGGRLSGIGRR